MNAILGQSRLTRANKPCLAAGIKASESLAQLPAKKEDKEENLHGSWGVETAGWLREPPVRWLSSGETG